jgi:hypothetical protein
MSNPAASVLGGGRLTKGKIKYGRDASRRGIQRLPSSDAPPMPGAADAYSCRAVNKLDRKEGEFRGSMAALGSASVVNIASDLAKQPEPGLMG